jgi:hypothetical protein
LRRLGIGIVLIVVPLMLLILPLPPNKGKWAVHKQDWILVGALIIAAFSTAAYFVDNRMFPRRSIWPIILLGTSLLLSANIIWNKKFRDYAGAHQDYRREVFRRAMVLTLHWPIYGRYDNAIARFDPDTGRYSLATLPYVLLASAIVAGWFMWAARRPLGAAWDAKAFAILIAFMIATMIAFALCERDPSRLYSRTSGYGEFAKDIHRFHGIRGTLRNYVYLMPTLEWYGQHYPPANLMLMQAETFFGIRGLTKAIVMLLTAATVVPLYKLARELELSEAGATAAVLLFAASTSILILCTINTTSLLVFPATMCLWMLVRGLKTGSVLAAIVLGGFYFFYLMFSFSASILGVLMAVFTILAWWRGTATFRNALFTALISGTTATVLHVVLRESTSFDLIANFIVAVRGHQEQQGNGGFDSLARYLLRSTGNVIAYLTSTVPLCLLAIAAALSRPQNPLQRSAFIAILATILIAGFSGLFYLETERIWIFLTPALALTAGFEAARRTELENPYALRALLLLVLVITCTQEYWFMHYR